MKRIRCAIILSGPIVAAWLAAASPAALAAPPAVQPSADRYAESARPVLQRYCFECHGPQKQKAQLRYDQLAGYRAEDRHLWAKVHEQVATGEMPPEGHPQPNAHERALLVAWIEREAVASRKSLGAGSTRRLNRREVSAALQDLTGLAVDYAGGLPGDSRVGGFDTGAEGLQDAADSVGQLMAVTRRAVDGIRFLEPSTAAPLVADFRGAADQRKVFDAWKARGVTIGDARPGPVGKGVLLEPHWVGDRESMRITLPPALLGRGGVVRLRVVVSAMHPMPKLPNPRLWVEAGGKDVAYQEVTGSLDAPQELVYDLQLEDLAVEAKGLVIALSNKVEVPYAVDGFPNDEPQFRPGDEVPGGVGLYRPKWDRKLPPDKQPVPFVVVQRVEVDPSHVAAWPPAQWKAGAGTVADDDASARRLLALWVERAWRRPAGEAEWERFAVLYRGLRGQGWTFDAALRATFQSVLMSGGFRYLSSPSAPGAVGQHAAASRLSFALWGAPPDDELRKLAGAGKLRDPAVLDAQVDRLLADPRSDAFVRPFVTQWLEMDQPITLAMDHIRKQDFRFGRHLKASMREETISYIARLLAENRLAAELVASDWTMMNDALAIHYGYRGVEGGHLRKVALKPDDPRGGGILGHAGIQSMLCWMGENWVIYRGAWVLRHVLDDPPPPPPLEVPELVPSEGKNKGKPFRELLVQHQADANCTVCHRKMDPAGFAFQNFDLSGRWRDAEFESYARDEIDGKIAWRGVGKTRPVDAVGTMPRGEAFKSYAEFKQLVAKHYSDDVVRGLMKNLIVYSAGRLPDVADLAEVRSIMAVQRSKGYPLRDVLKAVLRSRAFLDN